MAAVSDIYGNRIQLTCNSEEAGISMQFRFAADAWSQINVSSVSGVVFGTNAIKQSMGIPYVIPQEQVLVLEDVVSTEVLQALRNDKALSIQVRSQSGEKNYLMKFSLSGSNIAIQNLLSVCQ